MSGWDAPTPFLDALAHLFDHQEELPDDPVASLKRIGWVFAEKIYEVGQSVVHCLDDELLHACNTVARSKLVWCPCSFSMRTPYSARTDLCGWHIDQVLHVDSAVQRRNAKFTYKYVSPVTHKEHLLDLAIRLERHEFAQFRLKGQTYFWHFHDGYSAIAWHNPPSSHVLDAIHIVALRAAVVSYARYDVPSTTCLIHHLFTTSHESLVSIKRFRNQGHEVMPNIGHFSFYNQVHYNAEMDAWTNHNDTDSSLQRRLDKLAWTIRAITSSYTRVPQTKLPLLSAQLSLQRRSRFVRIARTLLLARAQAREEARARDPVKKCAACAIEAVKSQLALGIETASKRQRV